MAIGATTRYRFALHSRRVSALTITSALLLRIFGPLVFLPGLRLGPFVIVAAILGVVGLLVVLPMLLIQYSYIGTGVWIGPDEVRVRFPWENLQQMPWSEAHFAIDEGEEYLHRSKGKEGLGHLFGETRYLRLHLEGLKPEQRSQFEQTLAEYVEIRHPRGFTLITLLNAQGELVARGRLYLLEHELLCTENRGQKRVFFCAPLQELRALKQIDSFFVGKLECETF